MPHDTPLISTIVIGLSLAFLFGLVAQRMRLPLIAGYLMAGIVIGPFTPGYVADQALALELAELGVILLMFGVGLHFSVRDLLSVKNIAIPGALGQIAVATGFGTFVGWVSGWGIGAGIIFGLALSVASTVVLLRALQERRLVQTDKGRIAYGPVKPSDVRSMFDAGLLTGGYHKRWLGGLHQARQLFDANDGLIHCQIMTLF